MSLPFALAAKLSMPRVPLTSSALNVSSRPRLQAAMAKHLKKRLLSVQLQGLQKLNQVERRMVSSACLLEKQFPLNQLLRS